MSVKLFNRKNEKLPATIFPPMKHNATGSKEEKTDRETNFRTEKSRGARDEDNNVLPCVLTREKERSLLKNLEE